MSAYTSQASETCSCGATFTYTSWSETVIRYALSAWRSEHRHGEEPPLRSVEVTDA